MSFGPGGNRHFVGLESIIVRALPPVKQYVVFHRKRHPDTMGGTRIEVFLNHFRRTPDDQVCGIRRWLLAEAVVLVSIPFLAVAMARGVGYG